MSSVILRTATRYMLPLILLFSIVTMLQGHNHPGGGFIGGLIASAAFALHAIAFDAESTRTLIRIDLRALSAFGLAVALVSGLLSLAGGLPFMTGLWTEILIPQVGHVPVGTPLIFDVGVYFLVVGVTMTMILSLIESEGR